MDINNLQKEDWRRVSGWNFSKQQDVRGSGLGKVLLQGGKFSASLKGNETIYNKKAISMKKEISPNIKYKSDPAWNPQLVVGT